MGQQRPILMTMAMTDSLGVSHTQTVFVSIKRKLKHIGGRIQMPPTPEMQDSFFKSVTCMYLNKPGPINEGLFYVN